MQHLLMGGSLCPMPGWWCAAWRRLPWGPPPWGPSPWGPPPLPAASRAEGKPPLAIPPHKMCLNYQDKTANSGTRMAILPLPPKSPKQGNLVTTKGLNSNVAVVSSNQKELWGSGPQRWVLAPAKARCCPPASWDPSPPPAEAGGGLLAMEGAGIYSQPFHRPAAWLWASQVLVSEEAG